MASFTTKTPGTVFDTGGSWSGTGTPGASIQTFSDPMGSFSTELRFYNFDFSAAAFLFPSGHFTVEILKSASHDDGNNAYVRDVTVKLLLDTGYHTMFMGTPGQFGTNKNEAGNWSTAQTTSTYGGSSDEWGITPDVTDIDYIKNTYLGVAIDVTSHKDMMEPGNVDANIHGVWLTVWHEELDPGASGQPMQLRGTACPGLRHWHPGRPFRRTYERPTDSQLWLPVL